MDSAEVLRERERLLAIRYGADHRREGLDGEDLRSDDPRDAAHWVRVYTELVDFLRGMTASDSAVPTGDSMRAVGPLRDRRALMLELKVHELRLAFWTERLRRLRPDSG